MSDSSQHGLHGDWLPIYLPDDIKYLRLMIANEKRAGTKDMVEIMERKLKRMLESANPQGLDKGLDK